MAFKFNSSLTTGRLYPEAPLVYEPPAGPGGDYPADMPVAYQPALPTLPSGATNNVSSGDLSLTAGGDSDQTYNLTGNVGVITINQNAPIIHIIGNGFEVEEIVINSSFGSTDYAEDITIENLTITGDGTAGNAINAAVGLRRVLLKNITTVSATSSAGTDGITSYGLFTNGHTGACAVLDLMVRDCDFQTFGLEAACRIIAGTRCAVWNTTLGTLTKHALRFHGRGDLTRDNQSGGTESAEGLYYWASDNTFYNAFLMGYSDRPTEEQIDHLISRRNTTSYPVADDNQWIDHPSISDTVAIGNISDLDFTDNTYDATSPGVTDGGALATGALSSLETAIDLTSDSSYSGNTVDT